jgi:hypothetical protein
MNKRVGRFYISKYLIENFPDRVVEMFFRLEIIPVRAEMLFASDSIEYLGICPHFEECEPQNIPSIYEISGILHIDGKENYEIRKIL